MAIPAVVGLGLSAISTVSSISSQSRAAARQDAALEEAAADARHRIELARNEMSFVAEQAARIRDKELALNEAQTKSTNLQIMQQTLANELQAVQSRIQAAGVRSEAGQVGNQLLTQAYKEASSSNEQGAGELRQLNQEATVPAGSGKLPGGARLRANEQQLNAIEGARGTILEAAQNRQGITDFNTAEARTIGGITNALGELAASDIEQQQALQNELIAAQSGSARKVGKLQGRRNKAAIESKYYTTSATANMNALSQMIQERQYIQGLEAQRASIQRPGLFSYASAAGGLFNQGMQLGLFSFNNRQTPAPQQQPAAQTGWSSALQSMMPQSYNQMQDVLGTDRFYG